MSEKKPSEILRPLSRISSAEYAVAISGDTRYRKHEDAADAYREANHAILDSHAARLTALESANNHAAAKPESKPLIPTTREQLKVGMVVNGNGMHSETMSYLFRRGDKAEYNNPRFVAPCTYDGSRWVSDSDPTIKNYGDNGLLTITHLAEPEPTPQQEWPEWGKWTSLNGGYHQVIRLTSEGVGEWWNSDAYQGTVNKPSGSWEWITHAEAIRLIPAIADKFPLPTPQRPAGEEAREWAEKMICLNSIYPHPTYSLFSIVGVTPENIGNLSGIGPQHLADSRKKLADNLTAYAQHVTAAKDEELAGVTRRYNQLSNHHFTCNGCGGSWNSEIADDGDTKRNPVIPCPYCRITDLERQLAEAKGREGPEVQLFTWLGRQASFRPLWITNKVLVVTIEQNGDVSIEGDPPTTGAAT